MPTFRRIEVHFGLAGKPPESRKAIVAQGSPVQAIFLKGAEKGFLKDFDPKKVVKDTTPPAGVTLEVDGLPPTANDTAGPGGVCYLIGGVLHCWET